jgi:polar amino acid transport system substrate-binding protein
MRCLIRRRPLPVRPALALAVGWAVAPAALAGCSRDIVVPVAPTGFSVIVNGDQVSGVFPDALRELGAKAGCHFVFPVRPRARLSYMFLESGEADLLLPASRSAARDRVADYVPMMKLKVALVSSKRHPVRAASVRELLSQTAWRGVGVRSYVYGDEYNAMVQQLETQQRMSYAASPVAVARMLKAGRADFTIASPALFLASLTEDPAMAGLADEVTFSTLEGLPPAESGVYISRRSLSADDHALLQQLMQQAAKGSIWRWYQHYYPPAIAAYAQRLHP